jgi:hypothetical protein
MDTTAPVLRIRIRRIRMFLALLDPDPDPVVNVRFRIRIRPRNQSFYHHHYTTTLILRCFGLIRQGFRLPSEIDSRQKSRRIVPLIKNNTVRNCMRRNLSSSKHKSKKEFVIHHLWKRHFNKQGVFFKIKGLTHHWKEIINMKKSLRKIKMPKNRLDDALKLSKEKSK